MATAGQLPPEIMADRHLVEAEKLIAANEPEKALKAMNKIIALQQQHNLTLPDVSQFKYAECALSVGSIRTAIDSVKEYLVTAGRDGEFYWDALGLLVEAEQEEARRKQEEARKQASLPEMVVIPGGSIRMGCVSCRDCYDDEKPIHEVRVGRLELGKYE